MTGLHSLRADTGTKNGYVIVSGYVAILFGRSRGTEDLDILIPPLEKQSIQELHDALETSGYEVLNAEDAGGLFDMLTGGTGIRIAEQGHFIPNIELKYLKDEIDSFVLDNRITVNIPGASLRIIPTDIQIAHKLPLVRTRTPKMPGTFGRSSGMTSTRAV